MTFKAIPWGGLERGGPLGQRRSGPPQSTDTKLTD
jgi:hypothetical protein